MMFGNMPDISVIIPVYNTGILLRETVNSVLEQSYSDFELILVDDGSNSETQQILSSFNDERITVIHQENRGVACARNVGIAAAQCDYIALLDHDDLWHKDKLLRQKAVLDMHDDVVLVYSSVECFGKSTTIQVPEYEVINGNAFISELQQNKIHSTSCVMFRRDVIKEKNIQFIADTVPCDDWFFYLQMAQYGKFLHSPHVPVYYRLHEKNLSSDVRKMYLAGITVLKKIKAEFGEISLRLNIPVKTLENVADGHLVKHFEGLAFLAAGEDDFSSASQYLQEALHTRFSFKVCLKLIFFNFLKIWQRLKPFSK